MRKKVVEGEIWNLIVMRDGSQGYSDSLSDAHFKYGRTSNELERFESKRLPSGLIQSIEEGSNNLHEGALETGFVVEMTRRGSDEIGWIKFTSSVEISCDDPFSSTRGLYCNEVGNTIEFQRVGCPVHSKELPKTIWIRIKELPMNFIAWAWENEIFSGPETHQKTLDSWISLPELTDTTPILVLPGEPTKSENFI